MVAKEGSAKQQHYVPRYYLRGFVNARKQLYVVDRSEAKFFRVPTEGVGGEKYFNLVSVKGINPFAVEEALGELEGKVAPALERVKAAKSLASLDDLTLQLRFCFEVGALSGSLVSSAPE